MTDPRIARDHRQQAIADAIWEDAMAAITGNIPSAALAFMAEEDVHAAVHSLIDRMDQAGLTVFSRFDSEATRLDRISR